MTGPLPVVSKRSWPLLLLAVLAFLPLVGYVLAAIAITWGLLSDRPRARLAVGIAAAGGLLNFVGVIALGLFTQETPEVREAQRVLTQENLVQVVFALERFRGSEGRYPVALQELSQQPLASRFVNIYDRSAGVMSLQPYQYHLAGDRESYDLFSVGPDRLAGTTDDIRPAIPDSLLGETGYHRER